MPKFRVGLLGAGGIATAHARVVKSLPSVELVAVADVDEARAQRLAERWHAGAWYPSLADMMARARPDVVHIVTTPEHHARLAIEAMTGGAHVLVEKPLCVSDEECRAIEEASTQLGRVVGVNHNVTFEPAFVALVDAIRARRIGAVQHVAVDWSVPFGDNTFGAPLYRTHGAGAVMLETAPHPLSLMVRLVGEAHAASTLLTSQLGAHPDTWQVAFDCERGTAQCFVGVARSFTEMRVRVIGEDGVAEADLRLGNFTVVENTRASPLFFKLVDTLGLARALATSALRNFEARVRRIPGGGATDELIPMMSASIGSFYRALADGVEPLASMGEGVAVVRSCLRAIDAAGAAQPKEEGTWHIATASS